MSTFVEDLARELRRAAIDRDLPELVRLADHAAAGLEIKQRQVDLLSRMAADLCAVLVEMALDEDLPAVARLRGVVRTVQLTLAKTVEMRQ